MDCIFLGVIKPMPVSIHNMRAWVAPTGAVLCCDQQFANLVGFTGEQLAGQQFSTLCSAPTTVEKLLAIAMVCAVLGVVCMLCVLCNEQLAGKCAVLKFAYVHALRAVWQAGGRQAVLDAVL